MNTLLTEHALPAFTRHWEPLHAVLDMLPAAAYTCDRDGLITHYNAAAALLWGRAPRLADPVHRYCGSYRLYTAAGVPMRHDDCWMALALREQRDFDGREILVERPDGSRRMALAHARPTFDADGMLQGGVNVMVDITGQKNAETELRQSNARKDAFLATLAHELRNPLAPLRCAVPILRRICSAPDAESVVAMVERQVDHLVRLVDDLLEASRITRGKLTLQRQRIDVASVVSLALETSRPRLTARRHVVALHALDAPAWMDGDPVRLAQVVSNLLDNAAKFTAPGGTIALDLARVGAWVEIRVRDAGAGIPADVLPHVFDLFMQEERTDNGMQAGLGVGLALVKKLVELHGGKVTAHSEGEGKGSEFVVRLPLAPEVRTPVRLAQDSHAAPAPAGGERVLIVDDNRDAAQSLGMLVELLGNTVSVSFNGADALVRASTFQPSVVLLDLSMPGMSGFEVAGRLRELPAMNRARLVALSGRSEDEYRRRSSAAGFDAHLVKPIDLATLQSVLAPPSP